ncbi:SAC3 family protein B isoform X1 [Typha angustifolia]|uniref:SAC3 family protein B isoform X1 n=1 Tax=Typha angustifolia TaxID=59011 RepID=UPI003C2C3A26
MEFKGFGVTAGPAGHPGPRDVFRSVSPSPSPPNYLNDPDRGKDASVGRQQQTLLQSERIDVFPASLAYQPKQSLNLGHPGNNKKLSPVVTSANGQHYETKLPMQPLSQDFTKGARSPALSYHDVDSPENYQQIETNGRRLVNYSDMWLGNGNVETSNTIRSPPSAFGSIYAVQNLGSPHEDPKPHVSPPRLGSQSQSSVNNAHMLPHQSFHPVGPYADARRTKTPSPPKAAHLSAPKRARSPPLRFTEELGMPSADLDSEREKQAKAKRLARFHVELSRPIESAHDGGNHTLSNKQNRDSLVQRNEVEQAEGANRGTLPDFEVSKSSAAVVGLCPDMCPETEREERERKGDLDKYERLDGERNQTTKFLAVKKYNRTAEREADLIRPLPVLQRTVDYLLGLLDQPYGDNFLSIYNFLWDRMRAVRMDLRMQHIFNQEAIAMLEQMIRLHIIAMHELCEYNKGEGFSEGFDAHLNIEQMNKTSVELFQMYDDHRKKGIVVPTEKEFRGYYALLKLDKHPGYKVEPAELSLDLAKMSSELRCSPEISFAREVARACRIGNYISFFRLARKASYLQACLMHAHFAKLRTQALASLHSGLQNNQGIPIKHIVKWLGMEGEDIGSLLEYHGFVLKKYEELYLVKEGLFINNDSDFPTKCSQLVHLKKSRRIIDDAYSGPITSEFTGKIDIIPEVVDVLDHKKGASRTEVRTDVLDEQMFDNQEDSDLIIHSHPQQLPIEVPSATAVAEAFCPLPGPTAVSLDDSVCSHEEQAEYEEVVESFNDTPMNQRILPNLGVNLDHVGPSGSSNSEGTYEDSKTQMDIVSNDGTSIVLVNKENEVASEKLKLILSKWKQRATEKRSMREQKDFLATAALSSLSLGPPVRQSASLIKAPKHSPGELNIDYIAKERYSRQGKSWSRLNISELVSPIISERNPDANCICWKLLIVVQPSVTEGQTNHLASRWLLSKITGPGKEQNEPLVSLSHLSIWKKWICSQINPSNTCCLSVIRDTTFDSVQQVSEKDSISGTSCIIFLVSESIPWEVQRIRVHNLLTSLPSGSKLPLLIVSSDAYMEEDADASQNIINRLGLHDTDKTKINPVSVVFLVGNSPDDHVNNFFDDNKLREGLQWLADHSPVQPVLTLVKTRDLALSYLRSSLEVLDTCNTFEVGPDNCISAFNEALDCLVEEILSAASGNPNSWPTREIDLLEKSSFERMYAEKFLPNSDWSSPMIIEPLIAAIRSCKLPSFHSDISWLKHGSHMGKQIKNQKLALEECLISYMTQSSYLLNSDLAASEARLMVQKGVNLELRGSHYYIIPRWVTIFRRIYNWRLTKLTAVECSVAYVLEQHLHRTSAKELTCRADATMTFNSGRKDRNNKLSYEGHQLINPVSDNLSFDEVVEISCSLPFTQCSSSTAMPETLHPEGVFEKGRPEDTYGKGHVANLDNSNFTEDVPPTINRNEQMMAPLFRKNDRLTFLLEQCNQLQDKIDEKLAIYF